MSAKRGSSDADHYNKVSEQILKTTFHIPKMDCSAEEALIRMKLSGTPGVRALEFNLPNRKLVVTHTSDPGTVHGHLETLGLGAQVIGTTTRSGPPDEPPAHGEARTLWTLLAINAIMFVAELTAGLIAQSTGLIADSLDMFADAAVYGVSLYAVGRAVALKLRAAHLSGWSQIALALAALLEVGRRFAFGSDPEPPFMIAAAAVALIANVACLALISKHRHGGAHMKASWIFSSNDVLANAGVILAGVLVAWTGSSMPDLVIGAVISAVVLSGGVRILRLQG